MTEKLRTQIAGNAALVLVASLVTSIITFFFKNATVCVWSVIISVVSFVVMYIAVDTLDNERAYAEKLDRRYRARLKARREKEAETGDDED